ncbi:MAG TPA: metallophosphoesterase family protein [Dehalococcoidia bacterium]|nr:metallophosphoesterase family protein [Dehalococcoidia bacterium]
MRIAVVADVHSNLEAFEAVLQDARESGGFDVVWSLGDIVGYGPDPGACIQLLLGLPHVAIAGNHDYAATGAIGTEDFNPLAAEAARWTAAQLTLEEQVWLAALSAVQIEGEFTLAHGSLIDPVWDYLMSSEAAYEHLMRQTTPYGLVGHSHVPGVFFQTRSGAEAADPIDTPLDDQRFVANPGSVGQPRDGDPRAAYSLIDTEARRLVFRRVPYDIAITQAKMRAVGLPQYLLERLSLGR